MLFDSWLRLTIKCILQTLRQPLHISKKIKYNQLAKKGEKMVPIKCSIKKTIKGRKRMEDKHGNKEQGQQI